VTIDTSEWKSVLLGNHVDLLAGFAFKSKQFTDNPEDVPLVKGANVQQGFIDWKTCKRWPVDVTGKHAKFELQEGDVVLAMDRPWVPAGLKYGWIRKNDPHSLLVQRVARLRGKNGLSTGFLRFLIGSPGFTDYIRPIVTGVNVPHISGRQICDFSFPLPSLPTQRKISSILSAYDDLIENNLRRIKILEEMAQALYREWFVKFRFPGHEKVRMVDSPLGKIPGGWVVTEFRNLFEIRYGKTLPKTKILEVGPYPVYGAGDVIGYYDKAICQEKCALVTSRGNGSGTVWRTRDPAFVTNNSLIILPKKEFKHWDYAFIELLLRHSNVMEAKTGSAQPQVTIENLNYVKAIVPERASVEEFRTIVTPISEQVDLYLKKNTTLRQTRDLLLPRLISGELDVSDLEINIPEEAA